MEFFQFLSIIILAVNCFLFFLVFLGDKKARGFTITLLGAIIWGGCINLLYSVDTGIISPSWDVYIIRTAFWGATLTWIGLYPFYFHYIKNIKIPWIHIWSIIIFLAVLIIGTPFIVTNIEYIDSTPDFDYGLLYIPYGIINIFGLSYILFKFIRSFTISQDQTVKNKLGLFLLGLTLSFIVATSTNFLYPAITGNSDLSGYGPLGLIFVSTFTTYAIFKFQLFEIKLILAQIIVGTMSLILFGYVILSDNLYQLLVNGTIFIAFSTTGWLLTHQIRRSMEQVEEIEKANDELQEIIESKDIFLRMTSHQLRTPLTSLRGFIGIILDSWNTPRYAMNDNARHDLMLVHLNTHRLNSVVNDMLAINAIHSGRFGVSPREGFNLKEEFEYLVEDKKYLLEYYHTHVEFHSHGSGNFIIEVDHMRIKDVFHNVIDNAIYYGEGKIWIDIYDHNDDWVEIDICDNGKGLTEEQRVEIWGQDYRYDPDLNNANGTGMGLFITYHIIILHGGNIWAESAGPGQGSTFIIQLPKQTS